MTADDGFAFAPPPFKTDEALQRLQRDLRELGLTAREGRFERRGVAIARAALADGALHFSVVKRPSRNSPEWTTRTLASSAAVRDAVADLKRKLAAWSDTDD
jgi:hypothetical protein